MSFQDKELYSFPLCYNLNHYKKTIIVILHLFEYSIFC